MAETRTDPVICFPYSGDMFGGHVVSSFLLIEELRRRGWPVVLALHGAGRVLDLAREHAFPHIELPPLPGRPEIDRADGWHFGNLLSLRDCLQALRGRTIALVHVNDKRMLRTWALPAVLTRTPLLSHWRSVYGPSRSVDLGLRAARRIVSVSTYSRATLPDWAQAKTEVVYNPFRPTLGEDAARQARADIRDRLHLPQQAAVIGVFGSLTQRKRPHVLADLLAALPCTADGRPVFGLICGERVQPHDERIEAVLRDEPQSARLRCPGFVPDVSRWMAACDVIVAPAVREPLARVGIEAQSVGVPVIVSQDGGLKEVVDHGASGFVLDPFDLDAWIAHVRAVLDQPRLAARLAAGGRAAAARLAPERHASAIEGVYAHCGLPSPPACGLLGIDGGGIKAATP